MSLAEPITAPVPVINLDAWPIPSLDSLHVRFLHHVSSTVRLAPVGVGTTARQARRWQIDVDGRKRAGRARRRADRAYRTWMSWAAVSRDGVTDPEELQELDDLEEMAWHKFQTADSWATELHAQHLSHSRRRAKGLLLAAATPVAGISWMVWHGSTVQDAAVILGTGLAGSYVFGLVGRNAQHRAGEREHRRPELVAAALPAELPFDPTFLIEPHEDPLQLLRDIEATRREGETGVWTSVLVRRLKEDEQFGTRYSTLVARDLRRMLKGFATDRIGTPLEEGKARMIVDEWLMNHMSQYHPGVTAEIGESKPLAGFNYQLQIASALALGEATNESEFQ